MSHENNFIFNTQLATREYGVFFYPKDDEVFSASKIHKIFAVFESPYIDGGDGFVSWNKLKVNYEKFENNEIYTYVRASDSASDSTLAWTGPFLQEEYDISDLNKQFIQVRIIMSANYLSICKDDVKEIVSSASPILNSINIGYFKLSSAETFYTKTFNLGFKPKNIILTYNGTIPDSSVIQFAVAGKETTDSDSFHIIDPNFIEDISKKSGIGNKIKIMISGVGNQTVPFIIDEFSIMLSGDGQTIIT